MHGSLPRRLTALSVALAGLMTGALVVLHARMVISPAPQEMREGAAVWLTRLLLEGRNPYELSELPAGTNVYGIFYHLVVWPFARLFGNGFPVHRTVSAVSIAAASMLMYSLLRRRATDRSLAFVGACLFYASSLYFVGPLARPDGLGVLLSMLSVTLLFHEPLTRSRLCWGIGFGLLALITKIHLAFPPFVLAAYLFLFRSRRQGLALGTAMVAAATGLLLLLTQVFPTYVNLSLITNANGGYQGADHLATQTRDWLLFSLPLTVAAIIAALRVARRENWSVWNTPSIFAFASAANGLVFVGWLGWHPGAHMTYLFQLVTPVLMLALLPAMARMAWPRTLVSAALPVALLVNAHYFPLSLQRFADAEVRFARVNNLVNSYDHVLGSTEVAGLLALSGRPVTDSGESEYFGVSVANRALPGLVPGSVLQERWNGFLTALANDISNRRFDLIVRSRRYGLIPEALVIWRYKRMGSVDLDFAWSGQRWPLDLWEPRPRLPTGSPAAP